MLMKRNIICHIFILDIMNIRRLWILIHREELESLWRLLQDENDYFKIEPLK